MSPGVGNVGDTFKIDYDGTEKDVDDVEISVMEVEEDTDPTPSGAAEKVVSFVGSVKAGAFTLPAGAKPVFPPTMPASAPIIKIAIGGQTFDVKLPGADQENGLFELKLEMKVGKGGAAKSVFKSDVAVYVRYYAFPRPNGVTGPILTFITGSDAFHQAAQKFWKQHADGVFLKDAMGLEEIVAFMGKHKDTYGPYGEINIVAHGNFWSVKVKLLNDPKDVRDLNFHRMKAALGIDSSGPATGPAASRFPSPGSAIGMKSDSRVVFRACNIGNNDDLLGGLRKHVFGNVGKVYAPKFLQTYAVDGASEWFTEELTFGVASSTPLSAAEEDKRLEKLFLARYPTGSWAKEKATFTAHEKKPHKFTLNLKVQESLTYSALEKATKMTDDELKAKFGKDQYDTEGWEYEDETEKTKFDEWECAAPVRADVTPTVSPNVWIEPPAAKKPVPMITLGGGGVFVVGSSADAQIVLKGGTGVEDEHVSVSIPAARKIEVASLNSHSFAVNGGKIAGGGTWSGTLGEPPNGVTLTVGDVSIPLRMEKTLKYTFDLTRVFVDQRRDLKVFVATKEYKDRVRVVPDLSNSDHYGFAS
jgi:hypothetical protein